MCLYHRFTINQKTGRIVWEICHAKTYTNFKRLSLAVHSLSHNSNTSKCILSQTFVNFVNPLLWLKWNSTTNCKYSRIFHKSMIGIKEHFSKALSFKSLIFRIGTAYSNRKWRQHIKHKFSIISILIYRHRWDNIYSNWSFVYRWLSHLVCRNYLTSNCT